MQTIKFDALPLSAEIQRAVADMGFEEASPIQTAAIPLLLQNRDIIGQAQTGTGKTAAFCIPLLELIDTRERAVQAVVMCPTRELAIQVAEEIQRLGKYVKGFKVLPIYGGQPIDRQIRALQSGVQIVIGTPGRLIDHLNRGTLRIDHVKHIVLDEADEMLDMGFREDIEEIMQHLPEERQTVFFSATMPKPILDLTKKYQNNPEMVKMVPKELTVSSIDQIYFEVRGSQKIEVTARVLDMYNFKSTVIFCNTKRMVDDLVQHLQARGYFADGLHGDLSQAQRNNVMQKFRKSSVEVLVATDVAARGIDVENVEAVINYDLPPDEEAYVHRIGRTGRAGKAGKAFSLVNSRDLFRLRDIKRFTKANIVRHNVPTYEDVAAVRTNLLLDKVKEMLAEKQLQKYVHRLQPLLDEDYTSMEIAAALLKMHLKEQVSAEQTENFNTTGGGISKGGYQRIFVTVGKKDNVRPKDIVNAIADNTSVPVSKVGDIELNDIFSFVDVSGEFAQEVLQLGEVEINGRVARFELSDKKQKSRSRSSRDGGGFRDRDGGGRSGGGGYRDRERRGGGDRDRERGDGGGFKGRRRSSGRY